GQTNIETFIAQSLRYVLHSYPNLFPYMQELAGFDKETFKHSICVAETAVRSFIKYANGCRLPQDQVKRGIVTLSLGGFLHDMGKAGIERYSLEDSFKALRPEEQRSISAHIILPGQDTRTADERAVIHNHPTIGGYMLRNLFDSLDIPKDIAEDVFDFAFSHHEKPADLIATHNSYSRLSLIRKNPKDALLHVFLTLSDIAVSMREPRSYRNNSSLPYEVIFDELNTELSHDLLNAIFGTIPHVDALRKKMIGYVMSSIHEIDTVLTQKEYDVEGIWINGSEWHSTPAEHAVLIPALVKKVWNNKNHVRRLMDFLALDGGTRWRHESRIRPPY
ncbi:MAG: HD domain-containing protein, partial [Patescibacteria group bacterium]